MTNKGIIFHWLSFAHYWILLAASVKNVFKKKKSWAANFTIDVPRTARNEIILQNSINHDLTTIDHQLHCFYRPRLKSYRKKKFGGAANFIVSTPKNKKIN